ncbi:MAG: phosphatidate cytidylyltransferase [Candidatus Krumholzibacteriales bacterium]
MKALKRIIVAVIFIPCIVLIARKGGVYYLILVDAVIVGGIWEFYRMTEVSITNPYKIIGTAGAILLPVFFYYHLHDYIYLLITMILIGIMVTELCRRGRNFFVYNISVTMFGVFYVGWLGSHMLLIREIPLRTGNLEYSAGFDFVMLLLLLTWCYDTGAYTVGSIAGRHKMFPLISPGKTLEGIIGGIAFAIAGVMIARIYIFSFLGIPESIALALLISVTGQTGDLVESMIKRDMRKKDSSNTIPGHGGILDRFDSMLFNAPAVYYILIFFILPG